MLGRTLFILTISATVACDAGVATQQTAGADGGDVAAPDAGPARPDAGAHPIDHEICDNGLDDDGNHLIDDGCSCAVGATQSCFPGGLAGVCGGTQTCVGDVEFGAWGPCEGAPAAEPEICGDGIDQDCDGQDVECPRPTDACDSHEHQTRSQVLEFASPLHSVGPCPWGAGDNLEMTSAVMAARIEVTRSLDVPVSAVLCSMSLRVPETNMYYDDWMYMLFDDVVVLSPPNWSSLLEQTDDGLLIYDWMRIRGHNGGSPAYCPGAGSTCELPDTQHDGSIQLELDSDTQRLLFDRAATLGTYTVTVAATGDNDPEIDCDHSDFNLEVTYEYVVP